MGDTAKAPRKCPVISAFSELKQFSEYPNCQPDCAWYDDMYDCCALLSLARNTDNIGSGANSILTLLSRLIESQ